MRRRRRVSKKLRALVRVVRVPVETAAAVVVVVAAAVVVVLVGVLLLRPLRARKER